MELHLTDLPNLPQRVSIEKVASVVWQREDVVAVWVGGSLAREAGDIYSDVDFRIAVAPDHMAAWKEPRFDSIFSHAPVVGQFVLTFGSDAFLHHLVLANGEIFDFFVQSIEREPTQEQLLILGCRDLNFERRLVESNKVIAVEHKPVDKETVLGLLVSYWISSHKHRKVLYRNLDLMAPMGFYGERSILLRLWYIQTTGEDCGDLGRQTIHTLTRVVRTIQETMGPHPLALTGLPLGNRAEIYQTTERTREVVAELGRLLARSYDFEYPEQLEATVLKGWQEFREM